MGDEGSSVRKRKLERSNSRYYQRFINGDSIYTCFDLGPEREFRPSTGRKIVQPHRKSRRSMMLEYGPFFMSLEAVLRHRDQDRSVLWQRRKQRRLKRALRKANSAGKAPTSTELTDQPSAEDDADETNQSDNRGDTSAMDDEDAPQTEPGATMPDIPSSDLLRTIHHEAMMFYDSHDVLTLPPTRAGRKPTNWEEPIAMARSLDGSALLAIAVLLEEITKDQIAGESSNGFSLEGGSYQ